MTIPTCYLGDGAYAMDQEKGYVHIYTDRAGEYRPGGGLHTPVRHWVALEPDALQKLVDFARKELRWKIK